MRLNSLPILMVVLMVISAVIMQFMGVMNLWWRSVGLGTALLCSLLIFDLSNRLRLARIRRVLKGKRIALHLLARNSEGVWAELHTWVTNKITRNGGRVSTLTDAQALVLNEGHRIDGSWHLAVCGQVRCNGSKCHATIHFVAGNRSHRMLTVTLRGRPSEMAEQIIDYMVGLFEQHNSLEEVRDAHDTQARCR